jgi:hypothetical protein
MAGTIIADFIRTDANQLSLNVGNTIFATINAMGFLSNTGVQIISPTGTINAASIAAGSIPAGKLGAASVARTNMYSGAVLQVVVAYSDNQTITTSSTSFVTTSFSASITPTSASNKILVTVSGGSIYCQTTAGISYYATIYRNNSTNLGNGSYGLERFTTVGGTHSLAPHSMSVLDSPATTSATTYTPYFRNAGTASQVEFNNTDRGITTMTLMEIAV